MDLAYEFVAPSYTWILDRLQAVERRIEGLLTLIAAVTLAVPLATMAMANTIEASLRFNHWGVYPGAVAIGCVLATVAIGLLGRPMGAVRLADPGKLYQLKLAETPWTFRKDAIHQAGIDFKRNNALITKKSITANVMSSLLLLEIISGGLWAYATLNGLLRNQPS